MQKELRQLLRKKFESEQWMGKINDQTDCIKYKYLIKNERSSTSLVTRH